MSGPLPARRASRLPALPPWVWVGLTILALVLLVVQVRAFFATPSPNDHLPSDFPYAFLAPADNGDPAKVVVWRGRVAPATIDEGGVKRFPVAVCRNSQCPGLRAGQPFIFASGYDPAVKPGPSGACPRCGAVVPTVETWYTPEAERILVAVRHDLGAD